jgi:septal ring factor EnvC (AmiA/AmiB activator)
MADNELKEMLSVILEKVTGLDNKVTVIEKGLSELNNRVSGLESDIKELRKDVTSLDNRVSGLESDMKELRKDVTSLDNRVSALESDMKELRNEVADNRRETAKVRAILENETNRNIKVIAEAHQETYRHGLESENLAKLVRSEQETQNIRLNILERSMTEVKTLLNIA